MISGIIEIIIGVLVWKFGPGFINQGSKSAQDAVRLIINIIGIVLILAGILSILHVL
jgi:hypothetical protein